MRAHAPVRATAAAGAPFGGSKCAVRITGAAHLHRGNRQTYTSHRLGEGQAKAHQGAAPVSRGVAAAVLIPGRPFLWPFSVRSHPALKLRQPRYDGLAVPP